jgi:phospholipase/carboxylesterase
MNPISTTLVHKIVEPRRRGSAPAPLLVFLHGRGANEDDLVGLTEYIDERCFVVSARAPFQFQGGAGYTWYDLVDIGKPEPEMFGESYRKLSAFLDDVIAGYPVDPSRVILFGFSMGTIMSYSMVLTRPDLIAGVAANSGLLPEGSGLKFVWGKIAGKPFFVSHGLYDPVIPVSFARRAHELLANAKALVTYHEYEMGHQIDEQSLNDVIKWMDRIVKPETRKA